MVCKYAWRSPVVRHDTRKPGSIPGFLTFTSRIPAHRIAAIALIMAAWLSGFLADKCYRHRDNALYWLTRYDQATNFHHSPQLALRCVRRLRVSPQPLWSGNG